ncbi:zinc ribbon domain-containing protein, partial [Acidianus sp. RZ1]|uniref:zinc ribbon domain-containing protein n=1 Tax=Acidianus sp. RZ1 TaxID=1540082 RepID=UPI0014925D6E
VSIHGLLNSSILDLLALKQGVAIIKVPAFYASIPCPYDSGKMVKVDYRLFKCKRCGFQADRDSVARLNLLRRGIFGAHQSHHCEGSVGP